MYFDLSKKLPFDMDTNHLSSLGMEGLKGG